MAIMPQLPRERQLQFPAAPRRCPLMSVPHLAVEPPAEEQPVGVLSPYLYRSKLA
jgi:hypothetical protein